MVFQFIKRSFYLQVGVFQIGTGCQNSKVPKGYKHNQFTPFPTISCKRSPGSSQCALPSPGIKGYRIGEKLEQRLYYKSELK